MTSRPFSKWDIEVDFAECHRTFIQIIFQQAQGFIEKYYFRSFSFFIKGGFVKFLQTVVV